MEEATKHDENVYEKVDWSLVPWDILSIRYRSTCSTDLVNIQRILHDFLNNPEKVTKPVLKGLLNHALDCIPLEHLSVVMGYGELKYGRDNWKKGFTDYRRPLKAAMRHSHTVMVTGEAYDDQVIGPYTEGNDHLGAILFNIMVACYSMGVWTEEE